LRKGEEERNRKKCHTPKKGKKNYENENLVLNRYLTITFNQMKPTTINVT